ncbi:MAG TPA: phosphatase PAP2 family protein [Candidatus Paceibacterota bacterium]|nr:phosphatase PAP2 family protein [Candidatus Paceibacterota bacterium]
MNMNISLFFNLYSLAHKSNFTDWLITFAANEFGYIMIFLAVVFLLYHTDGVFDYRRPFLQWKNKFKEIFFVFFSSAFGYILASILKHFIFSPRPFLLFEQVKPLFLHGGVDSFPSGHAVFFGALAMSLFLIHKRIGIFYFIIALVIGSARVASGVHFPFDIIAGYIIGIAIAVIFSVILRKTKKATS